MFYLWHIKSVLPEVIGIKEFVPEVSIGHHGAPRFSLAISQYEIYEEHEEERKPIFQH
jgi:hypothetical protein